MNKCPKCKAEVDNDEMQLRICRKCHHEWESWHVTPVGDLKDHIQSHLCDCEPKVTIEGENMVIVHNSFDGREGMEMTNEILNKQNVPEIITLTMINLPRQRPKEVYAARVELGIFELRYLFHFVASEPVYEDPELEWNDRLNYFDLTVKKHAVLSVEMVLTEAGKWKVNIGALSFSNPVSIYFNTQAGAEKFKNKVKDWMLD